jgi:type I restriction enzyme S subunit
MFGDPVTNNRNWELSTIGSRADVLTGNPFDSTKYTETGIKICGGLIIMPDRIAWEDAKHWENADGLEKFLLEEDDIVLAMDRPWISSGFKIAQIQRSELPALLIQRTARIRAKDINHRFLLWMFNTERFSLHCRITETTVPHISVGDIRDYEIPFPPLDLQNRFAAFAEAADKSKLDDTTEKGKFSESAVIGGLHNAA